MTQEQVIAQREKLAEQYASLREKKEILDAKSKSLQRKCKHPNLKKGHDYDGGSSSYCADCGYQT